MRLSGSGQCSSKSRPAKSYAQRQQVQRARVSQPNATMGKRSLHTLTKSSVLSMSYVKRIQVYALKNEFCVVRYNLNFKVNLGTWFKISAQPLPHLRQPRVTIHGVSLLHFSRSRVSLQQIMFILNYHGRFDAYSRNQQWIVFRVPGVTVNLK